MALHVVPVTTLPPERFESVLTADGLARFERTIARGRELLAERTLWTVNSTARGGGVAEMLRSLIGYVRGAGSTRAGWSIDGDAEFFALTKRLHNRLHGAEGDGGPLGAAERAVYEQRAPRTPSSCSPSSAPGDVVLLHDPQTAGMVPPLRRRGRAGDLARAHRPRRAQRGARARRGRFLIPYVEPADAYVFSRPATPGRVSIATGSR